jgi:hypothetical protein
VYQAQLALSRVRLRKGRPCPACRLQFEGERDVAAFGGQPVLLYFGLQHVDKWAWLGWLALFLLAFLCLTWLALTCVRHQQR